MNILSLLAFIVGCLLSGAAYSEVNWSTGVREGGGGFYLAAPDQNFHLSLMGYGQFLGSVYSNDYAIGNSHPDQPIGFSMRRARFDALATLFRNYEVLFELGTPTLRVPNATSTPDVGLIEARTTLRFAEDVLQMRFGKFVIPFSAENSKSSRGLDTIERSNIVSSMIYNQALDTQVGLMLFGRVINGVINYYFGVFNGGGNNLNAGHDNDGYKQFLVKFVFNPHDNVVFGFGYETDFSENKTYSLVDHAMVPFAGAIAEGRRHGIEFDFDWTIGIFSLRTETDVFFFPTTTGNSTGLRSLAGSYLQIGLFWAGDQSHGFQTVFRYEWQRSSALRVVDLQSAVFGFNIYLNANTRNQINYIAEIPSQSTGSGAYSTARVKHVLLNELQIKF